MKKRLKLILPLILIIILGIIFYTRSTLFKSDVAVDSVKVKQGTLEDVVIISGSIQADESVILRFQTSGRLSWVGVKEGEYVKQYQSIASLDQRDVKKILQKDLNTYVKERLDFDYDARQNKDTQYDVNPQVRDEIKTLFEKNQLDLNNSVLDVELQNLALEYSNLWTPLEGIVTRVGVPFAGTNVTPSQAEFEIVNPTSVYFEANPDQDEVSEFFEGQSGELVLDAFPDEVFAGTIKQISFMPKEGETSTVYPLKFNFTGDNSSYRYRVGMTGDLSFVKKRKYDVLYLPSKYVQTEKDTKYVYIKQNEKLIKQPVETGMETDDDIEITKGLKKGEIVYDQVK